MILGGFVARLLALIVPPSDLAALFRALRRMPKALRKFPHKAGERLVGVISRFKYSILTLSVVFMISIVAVTVIMAFFENDGPEVQRIAVDAGGYVAIVGLVLGLPALCYAMVTDDEVKRIREEMDRTTFKKVKKEIGDELAVFEKELSPELAVQVFIPNSNRTLLRPIYDPADEGPEDGWRIGSSPQAVTGNSFAANTYIGLDEISPSQYSMLRLTKSQQRRYKHIKAVAAAPIPGPRKDTAGNRDPVGVLTVFSTTSTHNMEGDDFKDAHETAAGMLTDILGDYIPQSGPLTEDSLRAAFR
jgi:hypothetical protein